MTNWDDFRLVLAIVRGGGLSGAARAMKIHHATVLRRLDTLEQRLGVKLFERLPGGYLPTPAGQEFATVAEPMENSVVVGLRRISGFDVSLSGSIRFATADYLAQTILPDIFKGFQERYPDIEIEILVAPQEVNLTKRDADIALRSTSRPPDNLVGRRIANIDFAAYAHIDLISAQGTATGLEKYGWISVEEGLEKMPNHQWIVKNCRGAKINARLNSQITIFEMAKAGLGATLLPCYMADPAPMLERISPVCHDMGIAFWALTHPDLRGNQRVRAFLDYIYQRQAEIRQTLEVDKKLANKPY